MAFPGSEMRLRIQIRDIEPPIWRNVAVPADTTLDVLHEVLQIAFGWTDSHLHDFHVGEVRFGMTDVEDELFAVDERVAPLGALAHEGSTLVYLYDFGDHWLHDVTVVSIAEPSNTPVRIECLGGARACPPEDCGGTHGYSEMLRVLADPRDEEHKSMKAWVPRGYDAERFEIEKVNRKLKPMARRLERAMESARR